MYPSEVENMLDNEAQGHPAPILLHSYSTISPPGPLFFWSLIAGIWAGTACYHMMLHRKKPTHIYATLFHQITVILQISLCFCSESLWLQQLWFGTARVNTHLRNKNAALFQRSCTVHEMITSARGQVKLCHTGSFPVWNGSWAVRGSEPCLGSHHSPACHQHFESSAWPLLTSHQPFPLSCLCHTCQGTAATKPTGGKIPINLLKERWSESTCFSLLHGTMA